MIAVRHEPLHRVHHLVLEDHNGVVIPDRGLQQPLRVGGRGRQADLQSRDVRDPGVEALRVLRPRAASRAERRPDRQRRLEAAA